MGHDFQEQKGWRELAEGKEDRYESFFMRYFPKQRGENRRC